MTGPAKGPAPQGRAPEGPAGGGAAARPAPGIAIPPADAPGAAQLAYFLGQAEALMGGAILGALQQLEAEDRHPPSFAQAFRIRPFNRGLDAALVRLRRIKADAPGHERQRHALTLLLRDFLDLLVDVPNACCGSGDLFYVTDAPSRSADTSGPGHAPVAPGRGRLTALSALQDRVRVLRPSSVRGAGQGAHLGDAAPAPATDPAVLLCCNACGALHDLSGRRLALSLPEGAPYPYRPMRRDDFLAQLPHIPEEDWPWPDRLGRSP